MDNTTTAGVAPEAEPPVAPFQKPQIRPHLKVEVIPPKTVYLLGEQTNHVLSGGLYCQLLPLFDGSRTLEEIYQTVAPEVPSDHVDYVIDRLAEKGYLVEGNPAMAADVAAYWSSLGLSPAQVPGFLNQWQVSLHTVGDVEASTLAESLQNLGVPATTIAQAAPPAANGKDSASKPLRVVLTDDYLRPELAKINKEALASNTPWIIIRPVGSILWLGPVFLPGQTACWHCLAHRLRGNDKVGQSVLQQQTKLAQAAGQSPGHLGAIPLAMASTPSTRRAGIELAAIEITKWMAQQGQRDAAGVPKTPMLGQLITFDYRSFKKEGHVVSQRPQCPACGNPKLLHENGFQPPALKPCKKVFTQAGGYRAFTPEQTVARYQHLVGPLTGIVAKLKRTSTNNGSLIHNYAADHAFADRSATLGGLRASLGTRSGGKGKTDAQSRASGLCEGLERYSGVYQGDEPRIKATAEALGNQALPLESLLLFSEHQYTYREAINAQVGSADKVPLPLDPQQEIEWTPVWSLTQKAYKYVPTAYCYYSYAGPGIHYGTAHSNGNAAGNTLEEAIFQGFLEVIERDAMALWWYNQASRPGVDLASFNDPYFQELQAYYRQQGRELWVIDISTDFKIPSFVALSRRIDGGPEKIIAGFGAHREAKLAIERALTEVNQIGLGYDAIDLEKQAAQGGQSAHTVQWMLHGTLANHPYLAPDAQQATKTMADYAFDRYDDLLDDIKDLVNKAQTLGLEPYVLNQTQPDVGLSVVKVLVPTMRLHWRRFAPGRLFQVPVSLGWRQAPIAEHQVNPVPLPWA